MQDANELDQAGRRDPATTLRNAGVAGAGGAGFPSYAKWQDSEDTDYLLVNHQESEPVFYGDVWLLRNHAEEFASFFEELLSNHFDVIIVGTKRSYRDEWMTEFEAATDANVYEPDDMPLDREECSGIVVAYTDDQFQYGMEEVLLNVVADTVIGNDLPTEHGWVVHNTETLFNIYRALEPGSPVTTKLLHVCGDVDEHRFFRAPLGTPASELLEAAGRPPEEWDPETKLVTGGPGWCFETDCSPADIGIGRHTNGLIVTDDETVQEHTLGDERIDLLEACDWKGDDHETEPSSISPDRVRLRLLTNSAYEGLVEPSQPIVQPGDWVTSGELVAAPADGLSIARHASIDGTVSAVTESHIEIERRS